MDSRRSKKTRSYVEPPKAARASHASRLSASSSTLGARPGTGDRTYSAPSVAVSRERQERRQSKALSISQHSLEDGDDSHDENRAPLPAEPGDEEETTESSNGLCPVSHHVFGTVFRRPLRATVATRRYPWSVLTASCSNQNEDIGDISEVNVAVLGTFGVGKSTFVQCALDLKQPASSPISSKKVSLEGVLIRIRLLEVQLSDVKIWDNQRVEWPQRLGEQNTPRIDGALALYDVTDQGSTARVPEVLSEFYSFSKSRVRVTPLGCHWCSPTLFYRSLGLTIFIGNRCLLQMCAALGPCLE